MFARVVRYQIPQKRFGEVVPAFRNAVEGLREIDGNNGGYLLIDPDNCTALTVTLWQSREALEASEIRASRLRGEAVDAVDAQIVATDRCEVALDFSQPAAV
ncbi:MAG TPA: antibiotic biosynthesis monooxygenase [Gaiellaceae bacterium]|nr:antibiotic biosynthesis monooxygenase [Gaiellaceae bacterium]